MDDHQDHQRLRQYAEEQVKAKQAFYVHLLVYIMVNVFLVVVRYIGGTIDESLIYPALPWAMGLSIHWFFTFFRSDPFTYERKVQKEMERIKKAKPAEKDK